MIALSRAWLVFTWCVTKEIRPFPCTLTATVFYFNTHKFEFSFPQDTDWKLETHRLKNFKLPVSVKLYSPFETRNTELCLYLCSFWAITGENRRFNQCLLDWTNQCKSSLPFVAKSAFLQTATAAHISGPIYETFFCSGSLKRGRLDYQCMRLLLWLDQSKIHRSNLRFSPVFRSDMNQ